MKKSKVSLQVLGYATVFAALDDMTGTKPGYNNRYDTLNRKKFTIKGMTIEAVNEQAALERYNNIMAKKLKRK